MKTQRIAIVAAAICALACNKDKSEPTTSEEAVSQMDQHQIDGSFAYRERIALPPKSTATVTLSDVSRADAPASVITEKSIDLSDRSVPVDFTLFIPANSLHTGHRYAVRAVIRDSSNALLWTTDTHYPVDPAQSHQSVGTLKLVRVAKRVESDSSQQKSIAGTSWRVVDLNGTPVVSDSQTPMQWSEDGKLSGSTGCNRFSGGYSDKDGVLTIGRLALTRRACLPPLMQQEKTFSELLSKVTSYRIDDDGALLLQTADGRTMRAVSQ
ncbi:MAG: META domain-containing protein [Polyangiales bacterium]